MKFQKSESDLFFSFLGSAVLVFFFSWYFDRGSSLVSSFAGYWSFVVAYPLFAENLSSSNRSVRQVFLCSLMMAAFLLNNWAGFISGLVFCFLLDQLTTRRYPIDGALLGHVYLALFCWGPVLFLTLFVFFDFFPFSGDLRPPSSNFVPVEATEPNNTSENIVVDILKGALGSAAWDVVKAAVNEVPWSEYPVRDISENPFVGTEQEPPQNFYDKVEKLPIPDDPVDRSLSPPPSPSGR